MHRYIALVWDRDNIKAAEVVARIALKVRHTSPQWAIRAETDGLLVADLPGDRYGWRSYPLPLNHGVILGRLFHKTRGEVATAPVTAIDEYSARKIVATGGRQLIEDFWGGYVAFLNDSSSRCRCVIRDCSGHLPCYRTRISNVEIVFSDVADLCYFWGLPGSIDWQYVAAFLYFNELQIRRSGLEDVSEILAGECWRTCEGITEQFAIWDPARIVQEDLIDDYDEALSLLRDTTQYCVDAWASVHKNIVHRLSGGFDSAVVLGCLSRSRIRPAITCFNRYTEEVGEDERAYARLAAQQANVDLIESTWFNDEQSFDERLLAAPLSPKAEVATIGSMLELAARNELAASLNIDAFWTGQGGDHLFFQMTTDFGAADYYHDHGFSFGLGAALADTARFTRDSYWSVLKATWASLRTADPWKPDFLLNRIPAFVNTEALPSDTLSYISHPWASNVTSLSRGKQVQIHYLSELVNRQRPIPRIEYADQHHPLISQPLIDLCLQIPVYVLTKGGKQRALARAAFADRVPARIIEREGKGAMTSYALTVIRNSRPFVREFLLDGVLVRERLLNRKALEPHLVTDRPVRVDQFFPLFACIAAEAWARSWTAKVSAAAA